MGRTILQITDDLRSAKQSLKDIERTVSTVAALADPTEDDITRSNQALNDYEHTQGRVKALETEMLRTALGTGAIESSTATPPQRTSSIRRGGDEIGQALNVIERHSDLMGHGAAEDQTKRLERRDENATELAKYIQRAGSDDYLAAFTKLLRDPDNGHREFTGSELDAFRDVQELSRAMNIGTGSAGGYLVPYQLDPQIIITSAGSINPMRELATVRQTTQNELRVVTSAGVTASWDAEAAEVSDDSPTVGQPSITSFKGAAYLQASYEALEDSGIQSQVAALMGDSKAQLEANAFTLGTGSGQPQGAITGVVAAAVAGQVVTSAGSALAVADVIATINALPARWRPNAKFMANLAIINQGRLLPKYTNGPALVDDSSTPPSMMGWKLYENSAMDGTIAAGTTHDYVLLAGDFKAGYVITDRIGTQIEFIPNVVGANRRPTGERGFYLHWRTGGSTVVPSAFALLDYNG